MTNLMKIFGLSKFQIDLLIFSKNLTSEAHINFNLITPINNLILKAVV